MRINIHVLTRIRVHMNSVVLRMYVPESVYVLITRFNTLCLEFRDVDVVDV